MDHSGKINELISILQQIYPEPKLALKFQNPFQLLVAVILSAQCTDERVNKVTEKLFEKIRTPEDILKIPQDELEEMIKSTGYYKQKAKSLKSCCEKLVSEYDGEIPQSIDEFTKLPGVGRKTAAMVLGNAFGLNEGIAVDTHVKRVSQRLGITSSKTPEKIEKDLMNIIPDNLWTWFSNALILHGRHICKAKKPRCDECKLAKLCSYFNQN